MKKCGRLGLNFILKFVPSVAITSVLLLVSVCLPVISIHAETDFEAQRLSQLEVSPKSNLIPGWPVGPKVSAKSAILMDASSKVILYEKNIDERLYPASVTKLLTALVVIDNCNLDEMVTFSKFAIESIDFYEDANMGARIGDSITVEQALYALLVASANEVAIALAEHVSGPEAIDDFCELMNEYAKEIGCENSHFASPNGLHSEEHYTTAYDLALIASRFFSNEQLSKISRSPTYQIPTTPTQKREDLRVISKNLLFGSRKYAYASLVGSKTGYTDTARQVLASCAEKNNMKLVCIVMRDEAPYQYEDTIALFDYGFNNFYSNSIAQADLRFQVLSESNNTSGSTFFGSADPILQIDSKNNIILPLGVDMEDVSFELSYEDLNEKYLAKINYYYNDAFVGYAGVEPATEEVPVFNFMGKTTAIGDGAADENVLYINVVKLFGGILIVALIIKLILSIISRIIQSTLRRSRFYNKFFS